MTILIVGARGQVGADLMVRAGTRSVVGLGHSELDISHADAVQAAIETHQPRVVINAAAYTAVDKAESEPERAFAANRDGAAHLAAACRAAGIPLLHLSTDYVFDGRKAGPYAEDDIPAPAGVYGASKLAGEQAIRDRLDEHLILRVSWIFGAYGNNFLRTMLRLAANRPDLRVVADQRGGPTHAGAIADQLLALADRHCAGETLPWGTYHFSGEPATSWHGFAKAIFDEALALGLLPTLPTVHAISTAEYPTPAQRPANSVLDTSRAQACLAFPVHRWRDGLRETLLAWKHTV